MKIKIKYFLSFVLFFSLLFLNVSKRIYAQSTNTNSGHNRTIDSLLILIKKDNADTNKVIHLYRLVQEYESTENFKAGLSSGIEALELATKLNFKKKLAQINNRIGNIYYDQADYPKALESFFSALKFDEELKNKKGIASRFANIANVYADQANYPKSLEFDLKGLKIAEEIGDKDGIATHLGNIGVVYYKQGDYSKSLDYYFKALKIEENLKDKIGIIINLGNIGNAYYSVADYDKAISYDFKVIKIAEELGDKKAIARNLGNIGTIYSTQKNYSKALEYDLKALKMAEDINDKNLIAAFIGNVGSFYIKIGKFKEAEKYLKESIAMYDSIGAKDYIRQFEERLSLLYDTIGQYKLALIHYRKAIVLQDTLFSQENKKQLVRKELNYEFDKKEALLKAENEKQQAVAEQKNYKQKIIIWAVVCGLLLVLVFTGFIFRSLRITGKQKKIIESQKFQIVESINYSKKIQDSLLPSIESMRKSIPSLFLFYEPKDIVSGDFYFFKQFEKYTLLACVDCTGHGVPGGFMSTLGSLLLDKIAINETLSPSDILKKLSEEIIRILHQQNGGEIQDGMDLSICLIDHHNNKVEFSGARNGIIVVTNDQAKRYKADPLPVGGNYMKKGVPVERNFKTQTISVNPSDWIYMYTDGFMEQVGGAERLPMNYTQFENQLVNLSKKQTETEKNNFLQTELTNWRGLNERDDDVLIMGFRIFE